MELDPTKHYLFKVQYKEQCGRLFDAIDKTGIWNTSHNSIREYVHECVQKGVVLDPCGEVLFNHPPQYLLEIGEWLDTEAFINFFLYEGRIPLTQKEYDNIKAGALLRCEKATGHWFIEGQVYPVGYVGEGTLCILDELHAVWKISLNGGELVDNCTAPRYVFSLVLSAPRTSTPEQRAGLSEELRAAVEHYNRTFSKLKEYGMVADCGHLNQNLKIVYNPPREEY